MPAANVTVTAKTGPGVQNTAQLYSNVPLITFDLQKNTFSVANPDRTRLTDFGYDGVATVTFVIAGGVATVTIS